MLKAIKLKKTIFWIVIIVLILNLKNIGKIIYPINYSEIIYKYSEEYEIDPYLVCGIIKAESNFLPDAVSHKKARGLMQITAPTAEWIAEKLEKPQLAEDILVPEVNIEMGCYYICYLLDMYNGNEKNALCAYNAGFNVVDHWLCDNSYSTDGVTLSKIPYRETELYVNKVINNRKIYDFLYNAE